jgi:hypothetical protein
LRIDILTDLLHFAVSNRNGEDPMILKRPVRGFDLPRSKSDDENPIPLRYELGRLRVGSFDRFVRFLK